jgi:hypothetical protein
LQNHIFKIESRSFSRFKRSSFSKRRGSQSTSLSSSLDALVKQSTHKRLVPYEVSNFQLFWMAYRADSLCSLLVLPRDIITAILLLRSWFHLYIRPFDGLGVLSYLRRAALLTEDQKQCVLQFVMRPVRGTYLITSQLEPHFSEQVCYRITPAHSLEILGVEAESGRTFASSDLKGERHFAIDLQRVRLRVTHVTVACHYRPEFYCSKLALWGSNNAPSDCDAQRLPSSSPASDASCWSQITLDPQPLEEIREPGRYVKTFRIDSDLSKILKNDASFRYFRQFRLSIGAVECLLSGVELYGWLCLDDD